jgi:hypothetical protein
MGQSGYGAQRYPAAGCHSMTSRTMIGRRSEYGFFEKMVIIFAPSRIPKFYILHLPRQVG